MIKLNPKAGITLLELVVTLTIIAILLVTSLAAFDSFIDDQNTISAAQQAGFAIQKARYYAKANGVITNLVFTPGNKVYDIVAGSKSIVNNANFDATSGKLPGDVKILSNNCDEIYFNVYGSLVNSYNQPISNKCQINLGYPNGPQKSITIEPGMGNVVYDKP